MNLDPLADVPPPRYAIESDDEDEDERTSGLGQTSSEKSGYVAVEITFKTASQGQEIEKHVPLIVASGQAGIVLAHLLNYPSISSRVYANSVEIGYFAQLSLNSQKSKFTILVSESAPYQGILPLAYMHSYAQSVIAELQPSRVSILDTYSHPTYASAQPPRTVFDAPVRYLLGTPSEDATEVLDKLKKIFATSPGVKVETFAPPNLIHSTSATFMNISALPSFYSSSQNDDGQIPAVLMLLLPSPHVGVLPNMRPRYLRKPDEGAEGSKLGFGQSPDYSEDGSPWPTEMLLKVVRILFMSGGPVDADVDRGLEGLLRLARAGENEVKKEEGGRLSREVGEGGMYI